MKSEQKKLLEEELMRPIQEIPQSVKKIIDRTNLQTFSLDEKFINLQDPLSFIHNKTIQSLIDQTESTTQKLRKEMEQISQFSKATYKKIISRENNQFTFEGLDSKNKLPSYYQLQIGKYKKHKTLTSNNISDKHSDAKKADLSKSYRHKLEDTKETYQVMDKSELNYNHIKLMDGPEFEQKCKHVQYYEILQPIKKENHLLTNQPFDIESNPQVNKFFQKMKFQPVQDSAQFGHISQKLFYDFKGNLKFWKQNKGQVKTTLGEYQNIPDRRTDQEILSYCAKFDKSRPSVTNLCDFAMRKITPDMASLFFDIKQNHNLKAQLDKKNQNLDDKYNELKKQIQFAREMKLKTKAQRIPLKFVQTQSQTIHRMQEKDFDDYFQEDTKQLFEILSKFNSIRQKAMITANSKTKIIMITNINAEIKQILFKLLITLIKGEKFYKDKKQTVPLFTYSDLMRVENKQQVERKILQLVYTSFDQFQVQQIDGIPKSQIVRVYVRERQKNNQIQQIINSSDI